MFITRSTLKAGEFYDQFKKKKRYLIPLIDTFRRWLGGGKRSLTSMITANKESKKEKKKNRHDRYSLLDDLICDLYRNHSHIYPNTHLV